MRRYDSRAPMKDHVSKEMCHADNDSKHSKEEAFGVSQPNLAIKNKM